MTTILKNYIHSRYVRPPIYYVLSCCLKIRSHLSSGRSSSCQYIKLANYTTTILVLRYTLYGSAAVKRLVKSKKRKKPFLFFFFLFCFSHLLYYKATASFSLVHTHSLIHVRTYAPTYLRETQTDRVSDPPPKVQSFSAAAVPYLVVNLGW